MESASSWVGDYQHEFKSRDGIFKHALELLHPDHKTQAIAILGMGGIGKSTMAEQLKHVVKGRNMFDFIVQVVVGGYYDTFSFQKCVADQIGLALTNTRAECLGTRFQEISSSKKTLLLILDDVWERVALKNIGLNPLPNGFKLLLTSRSWDVLNTMAMEVNLEYKLLEVPVLEWLEALSLFWGIIGLSEEDNPGLYQIGCEIAERCNGWPLGIKFIAGILISQDQQVWRHVLDRLKYKDRDGWYDLPHYFMKLAYNHLGKEERKMFVVCGLFEGGSLVSFEDVANYAWNLKLFNGIATEEDARDKTRKCLHKLIEASWLMDADEPGCFRMHHIIYDFSAFCISEHGISLMIDNLDVKL